MTIAESARPATETTYDALLIVGFGGPEGPDDVIPFLENVLRGRNVPRERLLEVADHYQHFGGISPINGQVRDLIAVLEPALRRIGIDLPIYWGNRNWHPMLADAMRQIVDEGKERVLAIVLAAYSSYSSCRQYREDLEKARSCVGEVAPPVDKLRVFYNHPDFVAANADRIREALESVPEPGRTSFQLAFTAHSIPSSMASGCRYEEQLRETARLVAESIGLGPDRWSLAYQSRSGRPEDPWLGPDIVDHLRDLRGQGVADAVVHPIGFLSDHMEVLYDLDEQAKQAADAIGLRMVRSATVGTHPRFVAMLADLIAERLDPAADRLAIGRFGPSHDVCPVGCCPTPRRPSATGDPQR